MSEKQEVSPQTPFKRSRRPEIQAKVDELNQPTEAALNTLGHSMLPDHDVLPRIDVEQATHINQSSRNAVARETRDARKLHRQQIILEKAEDALHEAEQLSLIDPLTELPNRRWMNMELDKRVANAIRSNEKLWVLAFDIDYFKRVNDTYGHEVGDEILKAVAEVLKEKSRQEEPVAHTGNDTTKEEQIEKRVASLVARVGGEEFLQLLDRGITPEQIEIVGSRYAKAVQEATRTILSNATLLSGADPENALDYITLSFGAAAFVPPIARPSHDEITDLKKDFISKADHLLYEAKLGGRNRIVIESPDPNQPENTVHVF